MKFSKEVKAGLLVTGAIAALLWGMNYLKGVDVFTGLNKYNAVYTDVNGLSTSSPVILSGVRIGQVQGIEFFKDNSGKILVTFAVKNKIFIGKESIARIVSADLLGGRALEIILDGGTMPAEDGDTLTSELESTLSDQVMPIKDKAERLITSIDSLALSLNELLGPKNRKNLDAGFENLDKTMRNLESASRSLDQMVSSDQGKLKKLIDNVESITSNIKNNNEELSNALKNISAISDSLAKSNLASTVNNANLTLKQTAQIMEKINKGEGTVGMLINNDSLYNALEKSAVDLDKLLIDIKQNPKRYVNISVFGGKSKTK